MSENITKSLELLCELIVDCPHSTPKWTNNGFVVLRNQNIRDGRLDLTNPSYTDREHFDYRIKRGKPAFGDLVLTREAPMGEVCAIPKDVECCLGQRMVLIRPNPMKLDKDYLLYAIQGRSIQHQIGWSKGTGTTVSNLRIPVLKALKIPELPIQRQKAIAHKLKVLDDKIALNRRTNATLEAMAQALFKSWFVDFDPVIDNALAAGRELPDALQASAARRQAVLDSGQYPQLDAEVKGLFPDAFVWSEELGKFVPEGWEVKSLKDFLTLNTTSIKPQTNPNILYTHYSIPAFDKGKQPVLELGEKIKSGKYQVKANAILLSKLNPLTKRLWVMPSDVSEAAICSTEFMQFVPVNEDEKPFLIYLLNSQDFQNAVLATVTGSTGSRQRAQPKAVASTDVLDPAFEIIKAFCTRVKPFVERKETLRSSTVTLASLRDLMLGELIG